MKIIKPSDNEIVNAINTYYSSGNKDAFIDLCSKLLIYNARIKYKMNEDDISELCVLFLQRVDNCLENLRDKNNYIAFFNVYSKNLIYTIFRYRTLQQNYTSINPDIIPSNYNKDINKLRINKEEIVKILKKLKWSERVLISLKFNIRLNEIDLIFLEKQVKQLKPSYNFSSDYNERMDCYEKKYKMNFRLLYRYYLCLFDPNEAYRYSFFRRCRKRIINRISLSRDVFTIKEISNLMGISVYQLQVEQKFVMNKIRDLLEKKIVGNTQIVNV